MPYQRITDPLAIIAEAFGTEASVTLIVQGVPITGYVTPAFRHVEYAMNLITAQSVFDEPIQMTEATRPLTQKEREALRAAWDSEHPGLDPDHADHITSAQLCIRDAMVRIGEPRRWTLLQYILVDADHVGDLAL